MGQSVTPEHTCYSRQCHSSCPTKYYFPVSEGSTTNAKYSSWTGAVTYNNAWGTAKYYRRLTNICYLCHSQCEECSDKYKTTCNKCAKLYWMWDQQPNRCEIYCP